MKNRTLFFLSGGVVALAAYAATAESISQNISSRDCRDCGSMVRVNPMSTNINPFYISKTEVTWKQYLESAKNGGCALPRNHAGHVIPYAEEFNDNYAVTGITFDDMKCYINWAGNKDRVEYRLPTAAEWLYLARRAYDAANLQIQSAADYKSSVNEPRDGVRGGVILLAEHGTPSPDGLYGLLDSAGEMTSDAAPGSAQECRAFNVSSCTRHFVYGMRGVTSKTLFLNQSYILNTYSNVYVGFRLAKNR